MILIRNQEKFYLMQKMELFCQAIFKKDYVKTQNIIYVKSISKEFGSDDHVDYKNQFDNQQDVEEFFVKQKQVLASSFPNVTSLSAETLTGISPYMYSPGGSSLIGVSPRA